MGGFDYLSASYSRQYFTRHAHDEYLIGLITDGVHDVWCKGEFWHADAGSIATFTPEQPHFGGPGLEDGWSQGILYLPETIINEVMHDVYGPSEGTFSFHSPFQHDAVAERRLCNLFKLFEVNAPALEIEESLFDLLPRLFATGCSKVNTLSKPTSKRLETAREYIHANFDQNIRLEDLAQTSGLSKSRLIAEFNAHIGVPPLRYLMQVRLEKARAMLRDGSAIAEVAYSVGFADQSHLTRHFRAILGVTPARYIVPD